MVRLGIDCARDGRGFQGRALVSRYSLGSTSKAGQEGEGDVGEVGEGEALDGDDSGPGDFTAGIGLFWTAVEAPLYYVGITGGITITTGSGAPTSSQPNGSLYLRSDGTGPNLYVRQNGAWVSK